MPVHTRAIRFYGREIQTESLLPSETILSIGGYFIHLKL